MVGNCEEDENWEEDCPKLGVGNCEEDKNWEEDSPKLVVGNCEDAELDCQSAFPVFACQFELPILFCQLGLPVLGEGMELPWLLCSEFAKLLKAVGLTVPASTKMRCCIVLYKAFILRKGVNACM